MSVRPGSWRVLDPEPLVYAVASILLLAAVDRPQQRIWVQAELERQGVLTTNVDVHKAVCKLRRRYGWVVDSAEREPGYRLVAWPYRFRRRRFRQLPLPRLVV